MKKQIKKILKWTAIGTGSTIVLLSIVLGIHIYDVTQNRSDAHNANLELGRIDFDESVTINQAKAVKSITHSLPGVKHVYYNESDNILVYGFRSDVTDAAQLYQQIQEQISFEGSLYRVTEAKMASSCPVIDKNSITGRISQSFEKLFASIQ